MQFLHFSLNMVFGAGIAPLAASLAAAIVAAGGAAVLSDAPARTRAKAASCLAPPNTHCYFFLNLY